MDVLLGAFGLKNKLIDVFPTEEYQALGCNKNKLKLRFAKIVEPIHDYPLPRDKNRSIRTQSFLFVG